MAGTESSEKPAFSLRLLVDKKKDKVVLAEVGKDFVDVLFGFLALPMGTIVRLLENFQQNQRSQAVTIGCFNNLYTSVLDMGNDDFLTEACKQILLYPRYVKEKQCRQLKVNIDDTKILKYYKCPNFGNSESCSLAYSNFCSLKCCCGKLMMEEFEVAEESCDALFVSQKTSFIITENMKVEFASIALTMKTLRGLGYTNLDKLEEMFVDVNHKEVLALFHGLFSSETPLTNVFLKKHRPSSMMTRSLTMSAMQSSDEADSNDIVSLTVFVRKQDKKVIYAESGQDFVDQLFFFLVLPLEFVWEISGSNIKMGCIDNFCKSMKSLMNVSGGTDAFTYTCTLPWHYSFQKSLLYVCYETNFRKFTLPAPPHRYGSYELKPMYPNYDGSSTWTLHSSSGIVKRGTTYMISDDLTIRAANSSSIICIMKKWNVELDDIEEHEINISKAEAYDLLRDSLMTSTALTTALGSLLPKKP